MSNNNKENKDIKDTKDIKSNDKKNTPVKSSKAPKAKISPKKLAIIIGAIVVGVVLLSIGIFFLVDAIKNDKFFSYEKSDLTEYIELDEKDYKNLTFDIDIAKPKDIDVDVAILSLLAAEKGAVRYNGSTVLTHFTITPGTVVNIWYRGYLLDDNGEKVPVDGMSNFTDTSASSLEIGSGGFIPGFELGLVGINTADYPKFVKITDASTVITESHVAYVSYSKLAEGADSSKTTKASNIRIDISDDIDAIYGEGFKEQLLGAKIGEAKSFSAVIDDTTYNYTDFTVNFVTECEDNPIVVETYFPYDYNTTELRNETAYFEVYVESGVLYEAPPEFNDEFVKNMIEKNGGTVAFLDNYEGENLADKYRDYIKKTIEKNYEEEYKAAVSEVVWDYILSNAKVIKYPINEVNIAYEKYVALVERQYIQSGGQIMNQYTGEYTSYTDIDSYAVAYLGLTYTTTDWYSYLYGISQSKVAETLVTYYIASQENLIPDKEEFEIIVSETLEAQVNDYVIEYLEYEGKTRDDFTEEEYKNYYLLRASELVTYYGGEEYFEELAIYEIVINNLVEWTNVNSLDYRRAYSFDK